MCQFHLFQQSYYYQKDLLKKSDKLKIKFHLLLFRVFKTTIHPRNISDKSNSMTYNILIATLALFNIAYSKTACGNNWCYSEDVTTTSTSVIIQNGDDNAETTFEVSFTPRDQYCFRPSISFAYEKIDYDNWSETIKLYDNNNAQIAKCGATSGEQNKCPEFTTCLTEQSLGITTIYQDTTNT
eukprot:227859_1